LRAFKLGARISSATKAVSERVLIVATPQCVDAAAAAAAELGPMISVGVIYSAISQPNSCCRGKYDLV